MNSIRNFKIIAKYNIYRMIKIGRKLPKLETSLMPRIDEIGTFAYTNNSEMKKKLEDKKPVVLHYHNELFSYLPKYRNAVIKHEFVHIFDFMKFKDYETTNVIMFTYSEYHASQIEFMKLIKIRHKTTKCKKALDKKICIRDKKITIQDYFDFLFAQIILTLEEDISVMSDDSQAVNAVALIKGLMTFLGTISLYLSSKEDMVFNYLLYFEQYGYADMFIKLFSNVKNETFENDLSGYIENINDITFKYCGVKAW